MSNERIERAYAELSKRAEADLERLGAMHENASSKSDWYWPPSQIALPLTAFLLPLAAFLLAIWSVRGHGVSYAKRQQACDVVVQRLMATNDVAEVQRDVALIDDMDCAVTRRVVPLLVPSTGEADK